MIISECCTNWIDLDMAKKMIKVCHEINPNGLVKFQLFNPDDDKGKPHYDWVKDHALTFDQAKELFDYGNSIGQEVFFSVFAPEYVDWCEKIGVKRYKIACNMRDAETLKSISETKKQRIVSIPYPYQNIKSECDYEILYCPDGYPQKSFTMPLFNFDNYSVNGFSSHVIGLDIPKLAISRGAYIIECHFILNHKILTPDSVWSITPKQLQELVNYERTIKECL